MSLYTKDRADIVDMFGVITIVWHSENEPCSTFAGFELYRSPNEGRPEFVARVTRIASQMRPKQAPSK